MEQATVVRLYRHRDGAVALIETIGLHDREPAPVEYDFSAPMVLTA